MKQEGRKSQELRSTVDEKRTHPQIGRYEITTHYSRPSSRLLQQIAELQTGRSWLRRKVPKRSSESRARQKRAKIRWRVVDEVTRAKTDSEENA